MLGKRLRECLTSVRKGSGEAFNSQALEGLEVRAGMGRGAGQAKGFMLESVGGTLDVFQMEIARGHDPG